MAKRNSRSSNGKSDPVGNTHQLDEDLMPIVRKLQNKFDSNRRINLRFAREVGETLKDGLDQLSDDDRRKGHYFELMANAMDQKELALKKYYLLIRSYTTEELDKLGNDRAFTVTHLFLLAWLEKKDRTLLEDEVRAKRLTVQELKQRIGELKGRRRGKGAGRKKKLPQDVESAVASMNKNAKALIERNQDIWSKKRFDLFKKIEDVSAEQLNRLRKLVKSATDQTRALLEMADSNRSHLEKLDQLIDERVGQSNPTKPLRRTNSPSQSRPSRRAKQHQKAQVE